MYLVLSAFTSGPSSLLCDLQTGDFLLLVTRLVNEFVAFSRARRLITLVTGAPNRILSYINPIHTLPPI
jgi:hypothetical protein